MQEEIKKLLKKLKQIQRNTLIFLEDEENEEENFQNLIQYFDDQKIRDDQHFLRLFLRMINSISTNHYRVPNFFNKIERILLLFKNEITKYNSNSAIINIFKDNKRILLFLIEEKIIIADEYFAHKITKNNFVYANYPQYFAPEIIPFKNEKWFPKNIDDKIPENFYELRKIGENDSYICQLIRNDSVKDFIVYINRNNISVDSKINSSIYETNSFLIHDDIQIIEYAAFFGSIQIFNYLLQNEVKLTTTLWNYAIHSNNSELIHLLEDRHIEPIKNNFFKRSLVKNNQHIVSYSKCFLESIKCHHNDITNFILNYYLQNEYEKKYKLFNICLECYNFLFLPKDQMNEKSLYSLCKFDYYPFVELFLKCMNFDINEKKIQYLTFYNIYKSIYSI